MDKTILHLEYIDAADMTPFPCYIHPVISPAHYAAHTQAKNLLDFDVSLGRLAEEVLPELGHGFFPRVNNAIWGRIRVLEDTILAHQLHHPGDIMTIEGFIELQHYTDRRFQA